MYLLFSEREVGGTVLCSTPANDSVTNLDALRVAQVLLGPTRKLQRNVLPEMPHALQSGALELARSVIPVSLDPILLGESLVWHLVRSITLDYL